MVCTSERLFSCHVASNGGACRDTYGLSARTDGGEEGQSCVTSEHRERAVREWVSSQMQRERSHKRRNGEQRREEEEKREEMHSETDRMGRARQTVYETDPGAEAFCLAMISITGSFGGDLEDGPPRSARFWCFA